MTLCQQVKRRLRELPAEEEERRGAGGEDDLVDPPDPDEVTGEGDHHDAHSKGCMHVHRGPCAHLDASELCDIDKHHHKVATGDLRKEEIGWVRDAGQSKKEIKEISELKKIR